MRSTAWYLQISKIPTSKNHNCAILAESCCRGPRASRRQAGGDQTGRQTDRQGTGRQGLGLEPNGQAGRQADRQTGRADRRAGNREQAGNYENYYSGW